MGISTDAILFFGILIDEDAACPWADELDEEGEPGSWNSWEEHYAKLKGVVRPEVAYTTTKNKELHANYWSAKGKVVEAALVELDDDCHHENQMWFVAFKKLKFVARRGHPETFKDGLPGVSAHEDAEVRRFCQFMGIEVKDPPRWHLCSMWS